MVFELIFMVLLVVLFFLGGFMVFGMFRGFRVETRSCFVFKQRQVWFKGF